MKITNVRACQPVAENSPPDWRTSLGQILVAVDTDAGVTGYGVGGGGFAGIHVVQTVLRELLLGRDPLKADVLRAEAGRATVAFGQAGLAIMALSGVDLALWDVRGRAENCPVTDLLGGARHRRLPTYVTVWSLDDLSRQVDQGYRGFKLHLGGRARRQDGVMMDADVFADQVAADLRRARKLVGPDRLLMADAWMMWDRPTTHAVLDRITDVRLDWLEEPLPVEDDAGYAELMAASHVPIAGGEHAFTARRFGQIATDRLHAVLQPDVCWCGGLTDLVDIYRIAAEHGLSVCPHRGAELWSLPALAALDPDPLAESGRPWMTWVQGQPEIVDGWIDVPDRPGFGIVVDENRLRVCPQPEFIWS